MRTLRNKKLRKLDKTFSIIQVLCGIVIAVSLFIMLGSVGVWDAADQANIVLSKAEDHQVWLQIVWSIVALGASTGILCAMEKLREAIQDIMHERYQQYLERKAAEEARIERNKQTIMAILNRPFCQETYDNVIPISIKDRKCI